MDILIKNLKIPKEKYIRVEIHHDGTMYVQKNGYYSFYVKSQDKAIELPPHGRLISDIDVKALLRSGLSLDSDSDMDYVCGLIDGLPTIVEATE